MLVGALIALEAFLHILNSCEIHNDRFSIAEVKPTNKSYESQLVPWDAASCIIRTSAKRTIGAIIDQILHINDVVPFGGRKNVSPYIIHSADYIFLLVL